MTHRLTSILAVAAAAFAVLVPGATAAHAAGRQLFSFSGELLAAPGANAASLSVQVETGNKPALRVLLGASQGQVFTLGSATECA